VRTILAIDPGASGGIAARIGIAVLCWPMPETQGDILELIVDQTKLSQMDGRECIAIVEHQVGVRGPFAKQAGLNQFQFGCNYGFILGALQALKWRIELVRPQAWQKALALGSKASCSGNTEWKNKLKAMAQRLFPAQKVTLKTADALLLLEYYQLEGTNRG
jgi:hypothetical protein